MGNVIEVTKKTALVVLRSQLTKTIFATTAGFLASKAAGDVYQKVVIDPSVVSTEA
jgi:hypothetical protein